MIVAAAAALALASSAAAFPGEKEYGAQAKIGIEAARRIALHAYPGSIVGQELEKEAGGSGLRYSFDVKHGAVTHEVGVDAVTGKVLENALESGGD